VTISAELEAKILRYHHVERWRVGTIARQLGIHHGTVDRVLSQAGSPKAQRPHRASMVDPYLTFILQTLRQYPTLTAARLYGMVQARGYPGGEDHFRHLIAQVRPPRPAEAYHRLKTLQGEQSQVDWGHFGYLTVGQARRPLMAFVMVLSWSRQIFLRFYPDQSMASFLRGHVAAFEAFNGLSRVLLYDNLKAAVLERSGDAIRFNPTLLELAAHYRFEPRPVAVARGSEKGRVERAIRYIRSAFFAARQWRDLDDLNAQAGAWCQGQSADRPCPEDRTLTVRQAFELEQPHLLTLPDNPYPTQERVAVRVAKTPYVRFDLNDYSVPHTQVRKTLTVLATPRQVRIVDGLEEVARHPRSYGKGDQIEDPSHIEALTEYKRKARHHRGQDRLWHAAPASRELLLQAATRGGNLGSITVALLRLLDRYGATELEIAITDALNQQVPHPNAVRLSLERRREARDQPPPVPIALPDKPQVRNLAVRPHDLKSYDPSADPQGSDDHHSQ